MAQGAYVEQNYDRDTRYITDRIDRAATDGWPIEAGRYRLVAARACPWAHRAIIVRRLLGLEGAISLALPGPVHDADSWTFGENSDAVDPVLGIPRLKDAYLARDPHYPRGITVPAIVDVPSGQVVTNDFPQITLDWVTEWTDYHRDGAAPIYPEHLRDEIRQMAWAIYTDINNGVYRCGFTRDQSAYETAWHRLFARLDEVSRHLETRRYLVGDHITIADIRLFTTLVRFDSVYFSHFKCNREHLSQMPVLWAYMRDLFQTPGFGDTVDFTHIKRHYFEVHRDINPTGVVPMGPDLAGWLEPHGRETLGGTPFGGGTAPGPIAPEEQVPAGHNPLLVDGVVPSDRAALPPGVLLADRR